MQLPVVGFREWIVDGKGCLSSSIRGEPWAAETVLASCPDGHSAPAEDCGCGLYAIDAWPRFGDDRLYEHAAAPLRIVAQALMAATALGGLGVLAGLEVPMLLHGSWVAAVIIATTFLAGIAAVAAASVAVGRLATRYLLGAVLLSGRILRYENGVMRAERARIACLIRPLGVPKRVAGELAGRLGVPLFDWRQRERALAYLSEHGDTWPHH